MSIHLNYTNLETDIMDEMQEIIFRNTYFTLFPYMISIQVQNVNEFRRIKITFQRKFS